MMQFVSIFYVTIYNSLEGYVVIAHMCDVKLNSKDWIACITRESKKKIFEKLWISFYVEY